MMFHLWYFRWGLRIMDYGIFRLGPTLTTRVQHNWLPTLKVVWIISILTNIACLSVINRTILWREYVTWVFCTESWWSCRSPSYGSRNWSTERFFEENMWSGSSVRRAGDFASLLRTVHPRILESHLSHPYSLSASYCKCSVTNHTNVPGAEHQQF